MVWCVVILSCQRSPDLVRSYAMSKKAVTYMRCLWICLGVDSCLLLSLHVTVTCHLSRTTRTGAQVKDIALAVKNYQVEYNRPPLPDGGQPVAGDRRFETNGKFLAVLLGKNVDGLKKWQWRFV